MYDKSERKNCFDRFIRKTHTINVAVVFILLGAIALILCGTVFFRDEHNFPSFGFMVPGIFLAFLCLPGSLIPWMFRHNARVTLEKLKIILSDREIDEIARVSFVDAAIIRKAHKLQQEGAAKNDMSEYENFRQLAAMAGFSRVILTQSITQSVNPPQT